MAKQNIKDPGAHHNSSGALIRRFLPYLAKHKAVLFRPVLRRVDHPV